MGATDISTDLARALAALSAQLQECRDDDGSPTNFVGAARRVRWVASRYPLRFDGSRQAFRYEAEKELAPFFGGNRNVAKCIAWLACDAAWWKDGGRGSR